MPAVNEIIAPLGNRMETQTATVYQYNHGMILQPVGIDLPETYRVDFANSIRDTSKSSVGTSEGVLIPYEYFVPGSSIHVWIVLLGDQYAITRYHITIPVSIRATPTDEEPSPEEQSYIDQALAALNNAVAQTAEDVAASGEHAERAENAAENAEGYLADTITAKDAAMAAQTGAETAADNATTSADNAALSAQIAGEKADQAVTKANEAAQSAGAALNSATDANASAEMAATALDRAETAADNAEDAASHYPRIQNGYWEIWDPASGAYVSTGVQAQGPQGEPGTSPEISVASISGGHRITITDVNGTKTVNVMDGENGVGISSIVKTGTSGLVDTYTITYTDGNTTTFAVTNGEDGAPGVSPIITVTDITGGHRVTIADAEHPQGQSFDVMDGAGNLHVVGYYTDDGGTQLIDATYDDIHAWLYANETVVLFTPAFGESFYPAYTDRGLIAFRNIGGKEFRVFSNNTCQIIDDEYVTESGLDDALAGMPTDVQVNGVSVLQGGVANVPMASNSTPGVVQMASEGATGGVIVNGNGKLVTAKALEGVIKYGANAYMPIVPEQQHASTFYGLAKAAGDSSQSSSSNAVGTYTDSAKSAISQMLNAPVSVSGTTPTITALPGVQYVCGEVATLDITLPASGCVDVVFESGSTPTVLTITPPSGVTVKWANGFDPSSLDANTTYEINIADGLGVAGAWT